MIRSFLGFKRNQLQEAIAAVLKPASRQQSREMIGRVKRLLDTDRARGRNKRASDPEKANYAFYTADMPGSGYENPFSEYEAFALLVALRLMGLGLPQGTVVALLRRLRPELEQQHGQIVRQAAADLFNEERMRLQAKTGDLSVGTTDPRFIVIAWEGDRRGSRSVALCQGQREVFELFHRYRAGYTFTLIELVTSAHALSFALAETKPRTRGRARE
jgi:hypothetical protein